MAKEYDLVIIGGGPGGYVAAVRATQLGMKVAIVEKNKLGGTCLHAGCIPTKSLLRSAEVYRETVEGLKYGVIANDVAIDFTKVQDRKNGITDQLHNGIIHLMKKGKIDVYEGYGRILGPSIFSPMPGTVSVEMNNGEESEMLIPKNVLIATGSRPKTLPNLPIDGEYVVTSDEALQLENLPESIIIVGGGVIGVEWASILSDFGVDVTIIEYADRILPLEDKDISKEITRLFKKKKIKVVTSAQVLGETLHVDGNVTITALQKEQEKTFTANKMLVSIGRQANIENIGLENTDIVVDKGVINANEFCQTKESHIYAIGDVIGGLQLAHVASHEGIIAVEHMAGENPTPMKQDTVPKCVYSHPEVASVGLTEQEAVEQGYEVKVGKFSFRGIGKALVHGDVDGFVKMIVDSKTEDLLGVHMIGPHVTEMISEATLAKVLDATAWEISKTIHPHPALSEAMGEVALAVEGKALHG
ncbi:dihydrolipoyl dehydrogenase [Priestia taiwanensis]|uniref:Dihydrolipoyl dehydrogenase n=1 Tax=Priestia taiwanensis TaxID=1347902 RepID=A0A917AIS0_9BACI|nr:dihydrolipoyl dehydrogenase [Priestia taiwanensis]MBM7361421.1 dihydrolipoamide dehydrogenase [Priestia taiwanensis]GGE54008.1 dihydrolipoyl dehydrogenase [Priestia taiwanensis]